MCTYFIYKMKSISSLLNDNCSFFVFVCVIFTSPFSLSLPPLSLSLPLSLPPSPPLSPPLSLPLKDPSDEDDSDHGGTNTDIYTQHMKGRVSPSPYTANTERARQFNVRLIMYMYTCLTIIIAYVIRIPL